MLLLVGLCSYRAAAQPAEIIGVELEPTRVTLLSIDDATVTYIDERGAERAMALNQVLRVKTLANATRVGLAEGAVWLVDGQVLTGRWAGAADEETIAWTLASGQDVELSLDDVLAMSRGSADRPARSADGDDVLGLTSGESLLGFIETVGDASIGFVIGESDDAVPIPLERVTWMTIANDPEPADDTAADGAWVTLLDGARLLLDHARVTRDASTGLAMLRGELTLETEQRRVEIGMEQVEMIEPTGGTRRLASLSSLSPEVLAGGTVFGLEMLPEQTPNNGLRLHAPVTLGIDLPEGATRLSMLARLDLDEDTPRDRARLAGLELVIRAGGQELLREPIDLDRPEVRVNLPVQAGPLEIELDPAVNGPVLDRLRLQSAEVLIERP